MRRSAQVPGAVVMIRPHHFYTNPETASDNAFQQQSTGISPAEMKTAALAETGKVAEVLEQHGVAVHLFEGESEETPDCVFPNNWFSTHPGGQVAIFPMYAASRRKERRHDIIDMLKQSYRVRDVIDYSGLEQDGLFLEGTGAMVFDHVSRVAYAAKSNRMHPVALERFCAHFHYEPVVFEAKDAGGTDIYHTNVLMCIGAEYALIGLDMISSESRRQEVEGRLLASGREVIALDENQIREFAGNALELQGRDGRILALSARTAKALRPEQVGVIEKSAKMVPLEVPTIELSGGSVRCMLAGIHLTPR